MNPAAQATQKPILYLALGDSYTIGTGASRASRNFPSLIAARLERETSHKVEVVNHAVGGFTTLDLIARELGYLSSSAPDVVSILIGVNDLVQGRTVDAYRGSLVEIYGAVAGLKLPAGRVAALSIPEWSTVPAARDFGEPTQIRAATERFNRLAHDEAVVHGFTWVDLTAASTSGIGSQGWIAADQLHPGDTQYQAWAAAIWDAVGDAWKRAAGGL